MLSQSRLSLIRALVALALANAAIPAVAAPVHLWSRIIGDAQSQTAKNVAVDSAGNVFVTARISGTVDAGGGPLAGTPDDILLAKYAANGVHAWSFRWGDSQYQDPGGIATDGAGNVYLCGRYQGSVDFGGGPLPLANDWGNAFLVKLDANGVHQWSHGFGISVQTDAFAIASDAAGNVGMVGQFHGAVDFGGGVLNSAGNGDVFVAAFDPAGVHQWSLRFGDGSLQSGDSVALDSSGNVIVTGFFYGSFDAGGGVLVSAGGQDVFAVKFSGSGAHVWSARYGDSEGQAGTDVRTDGAGNIWLGGNFGGSLDLGGGPLSSAGFNDLFVAKLDPDGGHIWSRSFGTGNFDGLDGLAVDGAGNLAITGNFTWPIDLGGGPLTPSAGGGQDLFLAVYDPTGSHLWSGGFGGTEFDGSVGVTLDDAGMVTLVGGTTGTIDFGGGPLSSAGSVDVFVARLADATGLANLPDIGSILDVGNDQGRWVRIEFFPSTLDSAGSATPITQYEIYRRIDLLAKNERDEAWDFVGLVPAHAESEYNFVAPTLADSTIVGGQYWSSFFVRAATAVPEVFFDSRPDSGYSVDNLAPNVPDGLLVDYGAEPGNALIWNEPLDADFQYFKIYRGDAEDFEVLPENLVHQTIAAEWQDAAGLPDHHYKLSAVDFSGNESAAAGPDGVTAIPDETAPTAIVLNQNRPNPFNPTTRIDFSLPRGGLARLRVFDSTGRRVVTLLDEYRAAGEHSILWDGAGEDGRLLASGIYLYRLEVAGQAEVRRMVLLK